MMDFNDEQEVLISLREMENSNEDEEEFCQNNGGVSENGHSNSIISYPCYQSCHNPNPKPSLSWLDLRVFYVRISKCVINDSSTPEHLTLNHVPLNRDTLLEANGVRTSIYSDGVSTLLKRDRLDKKSEEVTFVCTDSIRMTGSVKFEVFDIDVMVLSGTLELCQTISLKQAKNVGTSWIMICESNANGIFRGHHRSSSSESASIEVYVAGCFSGSPIVLTRKLQLNQKKKHVIKGRLESIPEYESTETQKAESSSLAIQLRHDTDNSPDEGQICSPYQGMEDLEYEDGELSWFNAGVRVGVGIGLSVCLGVGIGVGLLARMYQGTTRNFIRHLH